MGALSPLFCEWWRGRCALPRYLTELPPLPPHRYLTELLPTAPMGLLSRLVSTNDSLMALLPLLEKPPWVRRRAGKTERWGVEGGMRWTTVEPADRMKLGQYEIQVRGSTTGGGGSTGRHAVDDGGAGGPNEAGTVRDTGEGQYTMGEG